MKRQQPSSAEVSVELRHDRVVQTWSRAVLAGVENLAVLGGEALHVRAGTPLRSVKSLHLCARFRRVVTCGTA